MSFSKSKKSQKKKLNDDPSTVGVSASDKGSSNDVQNSEAPSAFGKLPLYMR